MRKSFLVIGGFLAAAAISLLIGATAPNPIFRNQFTTNYPGNAVLGNVAFYSATDGLGSNELQITSTAINGYGTDLGNAVWNIFPFDGSALFANGKIALNGDGSLNASNIIAVGAVTAVKLSTFSNGIVGLNSNLMAAPALVLQGDSLTTGQFAEDATSYAVKLSTQSNYRVYQVLTNFAQSGKLALNMSANYASDVRLTRPDGTNGDNRILFLWAGINDARQSNSIATIYGALSNIWWQARLDGFRVVAFTMPLFSAANGSNATTEAIRAGVNTAIKADRSRYDWLIDADALFPNLTSMVDGIHLNAAANLVLAQYINTNLPAVMAPKYPMWGGRHYGPTIFQSVDSANTYNESIFSIMSQNGTARTDFGWGRIGGNVNFYLDPNGAGGQVGINKAGSAMGGPHALDVYGGATGGKGLLIEGGDFDSINGAHLWSSGLFSNTLAGDFGASLTIWGIATNKAGFASFRSNTLAPFAFTFPATTVKWTNPVPYNIEVYVDNTGVTGTSFQKNGSQIFSSVVGDVTVGLQPGEYISVTYTVGTPSGKWSPK